jgi:hypothetical protein
LGGKFHLKLNISKRPIANKYREGKMKRTLKRELKGLEIAEREAVGPNNWSASVRCRGNSPEGRYRRSVQVPSCLNLSVVPWRGLRENVSGC